LTGVRSLALRILLVAGGFVYTQGSCVGRERDEEPDRPFSGKFVVRIPPEVHREAFLKAKSAGKNLKAWVREMIKISVKT